MEHEYVREPAYSAWRREACQPAADIARLSVVSGCRKIPTHASPLIIIREPERSWPDWWIMDDLDEKRAWRPCVHCWRIQV